MKSYYIIIALVLNAVFAVAQKPDTATAKSVKTNNVDGTVMTSANNLVANIGLSSELTTLSNAINLSGTADTLSSGTITFFAPVNKAFEKLAPGFIDTLMQPAHKAQLIALVKNQALSGRFSSKDIERRVKAGNGQASFTSLSGGIIIASINENRNIVLTDENGDQSVVTRLDIDQSNGMLFIVTAVLLPKEKE